MIQILEDGLNYPSKNNLNRIKKTLEPTIDYFISNKKILKELFKICHSKYSIAEHSIHVATITENYLIDLNYSNDLIKKYTLAATFHDIGKSFIPNEILNSSKKLSNNKFELIKTHPEIGYNILKIANFKDEIAIGSLEHHLKLDGSGYGGLNQENTIPKSEIGLILSIINSYETLTNPNKNYKKSLSSFEALELLNEDAKKGKIDQRIFNEFSKTIKLNKCYI